MLKISKILNNNAAVVVDEQQREKVVIGKGISFQKKVGSQIDSALVDKMFHLSSNILNLKFQEVLMSLPIEQINVVEKIIDETRLTLGKKISDSIYVSLSDHIHFSLRNFENGITVKNGILLDIKRFYPDEYKIGYRALEIIKEETGVLLPDDEAGFIALHIVNAETENAINTSNMFRATKIIEEVLEIVKNYFEVEIKEDSLTYFRFINHLRYFSQRVVNGSIFKGNQKDEELLDVFAAKYVDAYQCCLNIKTFIKVNYQVDIGNEELLYLTIHVQRAIFSE